MHIWEPQNPKQKSYTWALGSKILTMLGMTVLLLFPTTTSKLPTISSSRTGPSAGNTGTRSRS